MLRGSGQARRQNGGKVSVVRRRVAEGAGGLLSVSRCAVLNLSFAQLVLTKDMHNDRLLRFVRSIYTGRHVCWGAEDGRLYRAQLNPWCCMHMTQVQHRLSVCMHSRHARTQTMVACMAMTRCAHRSSESVVSAASGLERA